VNVDDIDKYKEGDNCPNCGKDKLKPAKASEVGNVFDLGQKYTKAFDVTFEDENGEKKYPIMGCYGLGLSRTMGVIVEKFHDDKGIVWPKEIAPFDVHLVELSGATNAKEIYEKLTGSGVEVLWDDRDITAGKKFTDADLIGIPVRLVVSVKTGDKVEWKNRSGDSSDLLTADELLQRLQKTA
jgi:prolyl-tRNA synthetase